jgi:hypothetical protein
VGCLRVTIATSGPPDFLRLGGRGLRRSSPRHPPPSAAAAQPPPLLKGNHRRQPSPAALTTPISPRSSDPLQAGVEASRPTLADRSDDHLRLDRRSTPSGAPNLHHSVDANDPALGRAALITSLGWLRSVCGSGDRGVAPSRHELPPDPHRTSYFPAQNSSYRNRPPGERSVAGNRSCPVTFAGCRLPSRRGSEKVALSDAQGPRLELYRSRSLWSSLNIAVHHMSFAQRRNARLSGGGNREPTERTSQVAFHVVD